MKILIVEDDDIKAKSIEFFLLNMEFSDSLIIKRENSWQSGLFAVFDDDFNLILLDMSMPRYDSGVGNPNEEFEPFAGREFLMELKRRKISIPVLVVTSFDIFGNHNDRINAEELDKQLLGQYSSIYKGLIKYNSTSIEWKMKIKDFIEGINNEDFDS